MSFTEQAEKFIKSKVKELQQMNPITIEIISAVLGEVMENKKIRSMIRTLGYVLRKVIPGDSIEKELAEGLELLKEGVLGQNSDKQEE